MILRHQNSSTVDSCCMKRSGIKLQTMLTLCGFLTICAQVANMADGASGHWWWGQVQLWVLWNWRLKKIIPIDIRIYIYIDILYPNNMCIYHWISGSGLQPEHDKSTYNSAYNSEGFLQSWGDPPGPVLPFRHLLSRTTLGAGNIRPALKTEKVNLPKLDSSKSLGTKNKRKFGWLQLVSMILHFMGPTKFHVFNQY